MALKRGTGRYLRISKRAQISMEYTVIVAFVAILTMPLILIYYNYTDTTSDQINMNQLTQITRKVADTADTVYYLGKPSETTLKIYMPKNVKYSNISSREISFTINTVAGPSDIVVSTSVNVTGEIPTTPGIHYIRIRAEDNYVNISGS